MGPSDLKKVSNPLASTLPLKPDLNSFASRKTAMGGALSMGLFASNTDQMVTLIDVTDWNTKQTIKFWLLVASIISQVSTKT
jgi:hypothetical protein